jgi:hypothetical protein
MRRTLTMLIVSVGLVTGYHSRADAAQSEPAGKWCRRGPQGPTPIFRVTVVGHITPAVNYRPRKGDTEIDFKGTTLMPLAEGKAKVQGKKGVIDIEASFDKLQSPGQFGPEYLTYVLWAITPEGRATNLGEVQVNGDEARVHVTTELQAFGMILTAEPYFRGDTAQRRRRDGEQPSRRNEGQHGSHSGEVRAAEARHVSDESGHAPVQAEGAGTGRAAGSRRGAQRGDARAHCRCGQARRRFVRQGDPPLTEAESAQARKRGSDAVMMSARQAVQTAEDARLISLQKQEEAFQRNSASVPRSARPRRSIAPR